MFSQNEIAAVVSHFLLDGDFVSAEPIGSGHIHDTFRIALKREDKPACVILQRINHEIFGNVPALMQNIQRVTAHLAGQSGDEPDADRHALTLISTHDGKAWYFDANGQYWRVFREIPRTRTYDSVESPAQAYQSAKSFGRFQYLLASLPAPRLNDTIPGFHHTPSRFAALQKAIEADAIGRAAGCSLEIEFALAREALGHVLLDAGLPERVTHNDTKLNNVLFDSVTGEGICVIDLDTVMPGLAPYDFGDMVRTTTCAAAEDERNLARVFMAFDLFEALIRGFLESAGGFLTRAEKLSLAHAGQLITFEQGIRFLADHLRGDTYYKVHREVLILSRCRAQFCILASMEQQMSRIEALVALLAG